MLKPLPLLITLTTDEDLVQKLRRKLEEYKTRLEFQAPEVDSRLTYKRLALEELLDNGSLNTASMLNRCEAEDWFNEMAFEDALRVIDCYNRNDLELLRGGTGLR